MNRIIRLAQIFMFVWVVFFLLPFTVYMFVDQYTYHKKFIRNLDQMHKNADRMIEQNKKIIHRMDSLEKIRI